jgi:hypothetical protein
MEDAVPPSLTRRFIDQVRANTSGSVPRILLRSAALGAGRLESKASALDRQAKALAG